MKPRRKMGTVAMAIIACTSVAVISAGTASAQGGGGGGGGGGGAGNTGGGGGGGATGGGGGGGGGGLGGGGGGGGRAGTLTVADNCGGTMDFKERVPGALTVDVTEVSGDPSEVWTLQVTQQDYDATTGGRVGASTDLVPDSVPSLAFSVLDNAYTTTATIDDTANLTHGFTYVATRTSPTPLTCTAEGFWTDQDGTATPDPSNPTGKPDTAPAPTGTSVAHAGTDAVSVQLDQETQTTAQGIPATSRFVVTVNGVRRGVAAVDVTNDNPPNKANVVLTLAGAVLPADATVTVQYRQPLLTLAPQLQDLDGLMASGFGPITTTVS